MDLLNFEYHTMGIDVTAKILSLVEDYYTKEVAFEEAILISPLKVRNIIKMGGWCCDVKSKLFVKIVKECGDILRVNTCLIKAYLNILLQWEYLCEGDL